MKNKSKFNYLKRKIIVGKYKIFKGENENDENFARNLFKTST